MKLGFNTACFQELPFVEVVSFAVENGFACLEVNCPPESRAGNLHINVEKMDNGKADELKDYLYEKGIEISCLSYYANPSFDASERNMFTAHLEKLIEAANALGIKNVSTYTGFAPGKSINENLEIFAATFKPLLDFASQRSVNILLENSPLTAPDRYAGNFAYSPELWDAVFTILPDKNLGLNYDPSHLFWLGIDYMLFLQVFADRIFHVQAKDSEILVERLRMTGIMGSDWFRYRMCGSGSIDWKKFVPALHEAGYDGVLSVEHEDPLWAGNSEKVKRGLLLAKKSLDVFII